MAMDIISCNLDETVVEVLNKMMCHLIKRIPVIDKKSFVGEITLKDLIHHYFLRTTKDLNKKINL